MGFGLGGHAFEWFVKWSLRRLIVGLVHDSHGGIGVIRLLGFGGLILPLGGDVDGNVFDACDIGGG